RQPAVRREIRRVQPDADAGGDSGVEQPGGEVPGRSAVRRERESDRRGRVSKHRNRRPVPVSDVPAAGAPLMPPGVSASDFYYILPELVLTAGALLVLIVDVLLPKERRAALAW